MTARNRNTVVGFFGIGLTLLATLRLTRFVTSDWLGHWWIVRPARVWALRRAGYLGPGGEDPDDVWADIDPHRDESRAIRAVTGLDCPFCVGFWIGAGVLAVSSLSRRIPALSAAWSLSAAALALNYVAGHISSRLDK